MCNFVRCKIHFASRSCVFLEQWSSAKLCVWNKEGNDETFARLRHLYLAGRPSRWALAHFLVLFLPFLSFGLFNFIETACSFYSVMYYSRYCGNLSSSSTSSSSSRTFWNSRPTAANRQDRWYGTRWIYVA